MIKSVTDFTRGEAAAHTDEYIEGFTVNASDVFLDDLFRLDVKYHNPVLKAKMQAIGERSLSIKDLNTIITDRCKSPAKKLYVDKAEGYAAVIKSGSSIDKFGNISLEGDYIDEEAYEAYKGTKLQKGDVLLSSTGEGTLGKCAVFDQEVPAVADGHITVIRPNQKKVDPYYLCDYMRFGLGRLQVNRLFTGSTGQIELPSSHVDKIEVDLKLNIKEQRLISRTIRETESKFREEVGTIEAKFKSDIEKIGI